MNAHEAWKAGWEKQEQKSGLFLKNGPVHNVGAIIADCARDAYREGFVAGYDKGMMTALKELTPGLERLADDIAAPADDFERTAL